MSITRTPDGKVVLYARVSGQRIERWPIDAKGLLASRDYTADPPTENASEARDASPATVAPAPSTPDVPEVTEVLDDPTAILKAPPVPGVAEAMARGVKVSPTGAPMVVAAPGDVADAVPLQPAARVPRGKK